MDQAAPRADHLTRFTKERWATNPPKKTGRPRESKDRLTAAFWRELAEHFDEFGRAAIQTVYEEDPAAYLRVCASLMPKELDVRTDDMDPERLEAQLAILDAIIESRRRKMIDITPEKEPNGSDSHD